MYHGVGVFLGTYARGGGVATGVLQGLISGRTVLSAALSIGLIGALNGSTALSGSMTIGLQGTISGSTTLTGDFAANFNPSLNFSDGRNSQYLILGVI